MRLPQEGRLIHETSRGLLKGDKMNREVIIYGVAGAVGITAAAAGVFFLRKKLLQRCSKNPYEDSKMVSEYLGLHYCPAEEYMSYEEGPKSGLDFPLRCAQLCIKHKPEDLPSRALDIGCAVGRSTFELAREFEEVMGIDYSSAFIAKCQQLKITGESEYSLTVEGNIVEKKNAHVHRNINRTRAHFMVEDACSLPELGQFSCVLAANLICRLPDCTLFLSRLPGMVTPGGIVVFTNPFTWLEQYTPKSKWLGGYVDKNGVEVRGFDALCRILSQDFELVEQENMPFLIRETARKHQWTVAHASVWRRKK